VSRSENDLKNRKRKRKENKEKEKKTKKKNYIFDYMIEPRPTEA
jgi:F0F1-type ATP synthase assembly protein I